GRHAGGGPQAGGLSARLSRGGFGLRSEKTVQLDSNGRGGKSVQVTDMIGEFLISALIPRAKNLRSAPARGFPLLPMGEGRGMRFPIHTEQDKGAWGRGAEKRALEALTPGFTRGR